MRTRTIEQLTDNQVHKASSGLLSHSWESLKFANCTDSPASSSRALLFAFLFSLPLELAHFIFSQNTHKSNLLAETLVHVVTVNILMMNNNHLGSCSTTCTLVTLWNDLLLLLLKKWFGLQQLKLSWWCQFRIAQESNPTKSGFRIWRDCW